MFYEAGEWSASTERGEERGKGTHLNIDLAPIEASCLCPHGLLLGRESTSERREVSWCTDDPKARVDSLLHGRLQHRHLHGLPLPPIHPSLLAAIPSALQPIAAI